ncbi:MAG: glutamine synthetase type III [Oligoflexia bacterium]|nr:glutamine synthetase type III [Oligoflexia bacterium]
MRERLPARVVQRFVAVRQDRGKLDRELADAIAGAALQWALEHGATHFCHWFQPMTGLTAEKHDGFIDYSKGRAVAELTGAQLIQSEPDASSFPSGGIRSTFEARGYTVWDPSSPMYIAQRVNGATLCIPSCFFSYNGEALDKKIPLLRSMQAVEAQALRLCGLLGERPTHAHVTAGPEQEYFLVDRAYVALRPDLLTVGRTLLGHRAAKGQSLDDHYFGSIPDRVMAYMNEVETELYKLGVPAKTRHNEVAPRQFELAVVFDEANVAADHNQLVMEVLRRVASHHDLVCLLHEKPFAGINGSGKHLNWSMSVNGHGNMLEPGDDPHTNLRFLAFLTGVLVGVHRHAGLLRAAIASHGNDFRLGANEAPPAIISVFLGDQLARVVDALVEGRAASASVTETMQELGVSYLPTVLRDNTDRNRTSPFAFTGNKFEFRAVGSQSSISLPLAVLNTAVADGLAATCDAIEAKGGGTENAVLAAICAGLRESEPIRFEGNNYATDWVEEARRRGLPNLRTTPEALAQLATPAAADLFARFKVLGKAELDARRHIKLEQYITAVEIEADLISDLIDQHVLPAAIAERTAITADLATLRVVGTVSDDDQHSLHTLCDQLSALRRARRDLDERLADATNMDIKARATHYADRVVPAIDAIRTASDALEARIADHRWTLPRYRELLFQG